MTLKNQTFAAVRWTAVAMIVKSGLQFLQLVVLARFLAPEDFGLMAIMVAAIGFAQIFADMGISNGIIHHQKISQNELSSLYWLNILAGGASTLALILVSPWLADFYHAPRLQPLLVMVSSFFLITAAGQQLRTIAEKNLRFSQLAKIELVAALVGFIIAVAVVIKGGGVLALAAGLLSGAVVNTTLAWAVLAEGWRPQLRIKLNEISHFLDYGAYMIGNNLANAFNSNADLLLGGRILGSESLGVYSLPRDLSLRLAGVINPVITRVGLPVMAKAQGDTALLKLVYLKTMRMTASVNFPLYVALAVFAPEVVAVLFGNQWQESVPLLRILALWGLLRSIANPVGSLIFAVGRADLAFKWNLGWLFVISPCLWFGLHYGNTGLSIALLVLAVMGQAPNWLLLVRPLTGAGFMEYFQQMIIPFVVAMLAAVAAYGSAWSFTGDIPRLAVGLITGGVSYLAFSYWLNREWIDALRQLVWENRRESFAADA